VPGIIYAWEKNGRYIVYDGIHRLLAAFLYDNNMEALIQLRRTDKEQDIIDEFLNINKSISVPSIYLEETDVLKKLVCQNVANEMCKRFPTFVSPSRKPYTYNFNRDNLVEFISTLDVDFTKSGIDNQVINELMGLNYVAKDFVKRNNISCPKKCDFHKFYLWYLDKAVIKQRIENSLNV
jgi:hypothetical protein